MIKAIYISAIKLFFLFIASLLFSTEINAQISQVTIEGGKARGSIKDSIAIFKGIPFAAAPVDDLRWKAPQPVKPWHGIRLCEQFGPSPVQSEPVPFSMWSTEFLIPEEPISEDCLYLNVWSPAKQATEKRSVLVWIYGGGFGSGGSGVPIYDGLAMAKKGIIVVSINYRVGPFGFFVHPELTKESGMNASGNFGLMDQIAALKWVKKNIAAFGGDPNMVTIAGQSAGAMSVNYLVASPLAQGLFTKAIAESGAAFSRGTLTLEQAEIEGLKFSRSMNTPTLAEMRRIPAAELLKKAQGFRPIIDGYVLPDVVSNIFNANQQNRITLLTGWNEEEGILLSPMQNAQGYKQLVAQNYGTDAEKLLKYYPASSDKEAEKSQVSLSRDIMFGVPNYTWANTQANGGKVYVYRFTRKVPGTGEYAKYGAFHTGEVPYVFDNLDFVNRPWKNEDRQLAQVMSSYWVNFVKYGNPNVQGLPVWPVYKPATKKIMNFGEKLHAEVLPDQESLDFLTEQEKTH